MKKYFVISDIHGHYTIMKKDLFKAGYRKTNPDHILIVCGDLFDRGRENKKVFDFITSLPKSRVVLIRGNHEDLLEELVNRGYPKFFDIKNKTLNTIYQIVSEYYPNDNLVGDDIIRAFVKTDFYKFISNKSNWVDWYELGKFIFVHSFIPLKDHAGTSSYSQNWRTESTARERYLSRWGNPAKLYKEGLFKEEEKNGKILVCGHWHTNELYEILDKDFSKTFCPIYRSPHFIGIDACTSVTYRVNVLVIDEDELYDKGDKNKGVQK